MANPRLPDYQTKSVMLPNADCAYTPFKQAIIKMLRINDEQIAVNRYVWRNIAPEIDQQLIERVLYYRGTGMLFFIPETGKWAFLPYTLSGTIDMYGRYTKVKPLPFNGKSTIDKEDNSPAALLLTTMEREPVYDMFDASIDVKTFMETKCLLLFDYCRQLSQTILPRQKINEGLIDIESNMIPYMNTMLANSTGVAGMRVNDASEEASVQAASDTVNLAALNCKKWVGITSQMELQELSSSTGGNAEDFLIAMQSIDNIRLGTFGVDNGGIFEKKTHLLNAEAAMNTGTSSLVMDDGTYQRQMFCNMFNNYVSIPLGLPPELWWGCCVSETVSGADRNMDGVVDGYDNTQGEAPEQTGGMTDGEQE